MRSLLQRLPGSYAIFFTLFLFIGPVYTPFFFSIFYTVLHLFFINNNFRTVWGIYTVYKSATLPYSRKYSSNVQHVIIIPNYKESMDTLTETLDVLASHEQANLNYYVNILSPNPSDCFSNGSYRVSGFSKGKISCKNVSGSFF